MENKSHLIIMASSLTGEEAFESIDVDVDVSDSDSWQVIDPSDSDADDSFSYGDVTTDDDDDDEKEEEEEEAVLDADVGVVYRPVPAHVEYHITPDFYLERKDDVVKGSGLIDDSYEEEEVEVVEEEEEDNDDSDLDDELVPKWLNNKFERQRMRKLGKKVYPKMKKSKRLVNQYNKPGCVHGKHGLGMKA